MAVPKPNLKKPREDYWDLAPEDAPVEFDERRFDELLKRPDVVVYPGDPALAKQFTPLKTVGQMSLEELRRLMGREPDPEDENDPWYLGEDDEDDADPELPIST